VIDTTPHIITSLLAMGMALAFIVADRRLADQPRARAVPGLGRRVDRHRLADRLSEALRFA